jgi:hypothetical protein
MEYDFAIVYFGMTRSTSKVYKSHIEKIFDVLHLWKFKMPIIFLELELNDNHNAQLNE